MEEGTPQGGSISPLLANIYLHHVFDLWAKSWRRKRARGDVIFVRYADDTVAGFQHRSEAVAFLADMRARLARFGLELHPKKTRLIEFGRYATERRGSRGLGKPETFDFLGFTHICGKTKKGEFQVVRRTMQARLRGKLQAVKHELRRRWHHSIPEVGSWLRLVLIGHYRYYGVPDNSRSLAAFQSGVMRHWRFRLSRRSQKGHVTWVRLYRLVRRWLPTPRIYHPYPEQRLRV